MPELSDPLTWRSAPHHSQVYLFLLKPQIMAQGQIASATASIEYPISSQISIKNVTGDFYAFEGDVATSLPLPNRPTITFGETPGGSERGRAYLRQGDKAAGWMRVQPVSQGRGEGEADLIENTYFTVYHDYRVWSLAPRITGNGTTYKEYDLPVGSPALTQNIPPLANGGPGAAGFVDPQSGRLSVDFGAVPPFWISSDELSHKWAFPGGTPATAIDAAPQAVSFGPGFRWVYHTVVDGNGLRHVRMIPVFAAERTGANVPIANFEILEDVYTQQGHSLILRVFDDLEDVPDGTLAMLWEEEFYDGTLGAATGSQMRFIGWADAVNADGAHDGRALLDGTQLRLRDAAGRLAELPGFPQTVERDSSPSSWYEMAGADMNRWLHYLLHWHSSVFTVADYTPWSSAAGYNFGSIEGPGATLYEQADGAARAIAARLTCTLDHLRVLPDPQMQALGSRGSTDQALLGAQDIADIVISQQPAPAVYWVRASGLKSWTSKPEPLFVKAPGKAPGQGGAGETLDRQLVLSLTELRTRAGNLYALRNATINEVEVTLKHPGWAGIEPAWMEYLRLTVPADLCPPGVPGFTLERMLPMETRIEHRAEGGLYTRTARLRLQPEIVDPPRGVVERVGVDSSSAASDGAARKASQTFPSRPKVPQPVAPTPAVEDGQLTAGLPNLGAFGLDGMLYTTSNFNTPSSSGGPTWTSVSLGLAGTPRTFAVDPFSPKYLGTGAEVHGWLVTNEPGNLYRITDIFNATGARAVTNQYTFSITSFVIGRYVMAPFNEQGRVAVCSIIWNTNGVRWLTGTNAHTGSPSFGAEVQITTTTPADPEPFSFAYNLGAHISSVTPGLCYVAAPNGTNRTFYRSTNYGATWSSLFTFADTYQSPGGALTLPYTDENTAYIGWAGDSYAASKVLKANISAGTTQDVSPIAANSRARGVWGISAWSGDANRLAAVVQNSTDLTYHVYTSTDAAATWSLKTSYGTSANPVPENLAIAGDNSNAVYLWGFNGFVGYSSDFCASIDARPVPGTARIIGICGG